MSGKLTCITTIAEQLGSSRLQARSTPAASSPQPSRFMLGKVLRNCGMP